MADVLIVDDDGDLADLLADLLREEGYEVRTACNGQESLTLLQDKRPDVVLLDVEMPVLTGPEMAYTMFLRDLGLDRIPVVLLSGALDLRSVAAAVGTPYFMAKPYMIDRLLELVRRALVERIPPRPDTSVASARPE